MAGKRRQGYRPHVPSFKLSGLLWMLPLLLLQSLSLQPAQAAEARIVLDLAYVASGIGYQQGTATVTLNGRTARFEVKGPQFLGAGASNFHGEGTLSGANSFADIEGEYTVTRSSVSAVFGGTSLNLRNTEGVHMRLQGGSKGIDVTFGPGTLTFTRLR